ncbi:MAG: YitT family protein [Bacteroidales bacterium]|nr:YitT family protein [Bacteroidales bacterium]
MMANKFKIDSAREYFTILVGLALYALGWTGFLLPHEITTGGVTGIGALIYFAKGIPVAVTYFAINIVLLFMSIRIFGWKFSVKTIFGVGVLTVFLSVAQSLIKRPLLVEEPFMACVVGGVLTGVGIGIVFTANGSTGGTDIIALIINKYRNITLGRAILYSDLIIISSSYILFQSIEKIIFGITTLVISTYFIDFVVNGVRQSVQFFIFSREHEKIAERISIEAHRGVTVLDGMGWYSKDPVKVLVVMARKNESVKIFRIVKQTDPQAFVSQSSVIGVYGQGFDIIKSK